MQLRPYQEHGLNLLRERFQAGDKKIMFWLATGGGKSVIFKTLISNLINNKRNVLLVMRRRELIFQAAKHIESMGIKVSVIMGTEKGFNPDLDCQICSIDTIGKRIEKEKYHFLKKFDFTIIDECHDCTSNTYKKFLDEMKNSHHIGFTATPFPMGNKVHEHWDSVVKPIEVHQLRDQGFLVDDRVYAPKKINVEGIRKVSGEFHAGQLFDAVSEMEVIGDIVDTYKKIGQSKPALLFAVNINHSKLMAEAFRQSGIPAIHCDQSHNKHEREEATNGLRTGKYKVVCNVNIFSTGIDIYVEVGIMARPTMSETLYIQQAGRILRPYKICLHCKTERGAEEICPVCKKSELSYEKPYAIFLDHADNTSRHGFIYDVREAALEKKKKQTMIISMNLTRTCDHCYAVLKPSQKVCPYCGGVKSITNAREVNEKDGDLSLVTELDVMENLKDKILKEYNQLKNVSSLCNWHYTAVYYKLYKKFGEKIYETKVNEIIGFPEFVAQNERQKRLLQSASKLIEGGNAGRSKVFS